MYNKSLTYSYCSIFKQKLHLWVEFKEDILRIKSEISQIPDTLATLCGKILIRSTDIRVSSTVLETRDSQFAERATALFQMITGKAPEALRTAVLSA